MPYLLTGIFFRNFFLLQTFKWMKVGFQKAKLFFRKFFLWDAWTTVPHP